VGLIESSSENISLSAHLPGVVDKVYVKAGQDVEAGAPLIKLDTRALEASLIEKEADLVSKRAAVATAQAHVTRAEAGLSDVQKLLAFAVKLIASHTMSDEDITHRRSAVEIAEADLGSAHTEVTAAEAAVKVSEAAIHAVRTDLERSVVNAPIKGRILQVRIRLGEYATAGPGAEPWMIMGRVDPLHVRVDVDEHEAWRVSSDAAAEAQVRGNSNLKTRLKFVRFEPLVVPKQSLTGDSIERVDTRVLQVLYAVENPSLPLFIGQQMDVFISAVNTPKVAQLGH
jgi:multidrug resistance efflux pump